MVGRLLRQAQAEYGLVSLRVCLRSFPRHAQRFAILRTLDQHAHEVLQQPVVEHCRSTRGTKMRQRLFQSALAREQRRKPCVGGRGARLENEHTPVARFGR
jgi:hypothetical protein